MPPCERPSAPCKHVSLGPIELTAVMLAVPLAVPLVVPLVIMLVGEQ